MKKLTTLALLATLTATHGAAGETAPPPFTLPNTEVQQLHAAKLNRDYELYISLPKSYGTSSKNYPVVFITDAPYAFPVTASIGGFVSRHSKALPEFIVVGLSYAKGDSAEFSRRRDYTPTPYYGGGMTSDMPGRAPAFGEAEGYRRFLADEVLPFVAAHYRADMAHKVLAGHSYGSLFGGYVLLTEPDMFEGYILGSPSLWYGNRVLFEKERSFAATHRKLPARVYIGTGAYEGFAPKNHAGDTHYNTENDMVEDAAEFARALGSHHYAGLQLRNEVIAQENHLTVAPILLTHGLLWTLGDEKQ